MQHLFAKRKQSDSILMLCNINCLRSTSMLGRFSANLVAKRGTLVNTRLMSEDSEDQGKGSIYSKDIAFKPAEGGWGLGSKYNENFDTIFGKKSAEESKGDALEMKESSTSRDEK